MDSLQSIAIKQVFANISNDTVENDLSLMDIIPINAETTPAIEDFIRDYIMKKPSILTNIIKKMYLVYFRLRDEFTIRDIDKDKYNASGVLRVCFSMNEARNWIIKNGREQAEELEDNYGRPIILFIVETDDSYDFWDYDTLAPITSQYYETYVFTKDAYELLLKEYEYLYCGDWIPTNTIPFWIHYHTETGEIIRGCSLEQLNNILCVIEYIVDDEKKKDEHRADLARFLENPDKWR
jgi:hypothetical protein